MAPSLEAVYPTGGKQERMEMAREERGTGGKYEGLSAAEVPVISFTGAPWGCKLPTGTGSALPSRTLEAPPIGGVRNIPERPEPMYPTPFKTRDMPPHRLQEAADLSAAHHRKSMFVDAHRHMTTQVNHRPPPHGLPPPKSATSPSSNCNGSDAAAAAAAAAATASVFFQRAFPPPGIPGYPHGARLPGAPHPGLHPGNHPHHPHYPGVPASAAGFMSLAHILFQPKYPMGKKTFQCHQCRYITDRKNNLKRHIATMHQDCGKFLECCDTIFRSKASLRDHVLMYHRTGYKCRFCGRNFCRKALLKRHLTVHNGQKEFICEVCDYATSHKSNLERHRKVHGLGSPIGSEDGDLFLQDGPDAEIYASRHMRHESDEMVSPNYLHDMRNVDDVSRRDVINRGGDMYVDVESMNTDSVSDDSGDEDVSVMSESNVVDDNMAADMSIVSQGRPPADDHVTLRADPLLEAFPVGSASGKIVGRKLKGRTYLTDRLRQTYDHQNSEEKCHKNDSKDLSRISAIVSERNPNYRGEDGEERELDFIKRDSCSSDGRLRPAAASPRHGSPSPPSPPVKTGRAGLFPEERPIPANQADAAAVDRDDKKISRTPMGKGCKRLYASPYKCSECGLGLSSQQKLVDHSMVCRKQGVEPARPIKTLTSQFAREKLPTPAVCYYPDSTDKPQDLSLNHTDLINNQKYSPQKRDAILATCDPNEQFEISTDRSRKRGAPENSSFSPLKLVRLPQPTADRGARVYHDAEMARERLPAGRTGLPARRDFSVERLVEGGDVPRPRFPDPLTALRHRFAPESAPVTSDRRVPSPSYSGGDELGKVLPIKKRSVNHFSD